MKCLERKISEMSFDSSEEDSNEWSDCSRILHLRRNSELDGTQDSDLGSSSDMDSDEESESRSSSNNQWRRRKYNIMLNGEVSKWNLSLLSWASEMSLIDKLSPRRANSLAHFRLPVTPPECPTPKEFQGINWKKFIDNPSDCSPSCSCSGSNCGLGPCPSLVSNAVSEDVIAGVEEDELVEWNAHEEDVGESDSGSIWSSSKMSETSVKTNNKGEIERKHIVRLQKREEEKQSKSGGTPKFNVESHSSSGEPLFDYSNLLVNYLPPEMNSSMLHDLFSKYGTIVSCKVVIDYPSGLSKGYGFVKFGTDKEGKAARKAVNKHQIGKKTLKVSFSRLPQHGKRAEYSNLYVSNLDPKVDSEDLASLLRTCGFVVQCKVLRNSKGDSKQAAYVRFANDTSARLAITRFDGKQLEGTDRPMVIRFARSRGLQTSVPGSPTPTLGVLKSPQKRQHVTVSSSVCYVTGFDVSLSENILRRVVAPRGTNKVKSIRIIPRKKRPYAFLNFYNSDDAAEAAITLNNKNIGNCTLIARLKL